ncbi:MAG TPA: imidazolonepropionase, partial [Bacteroidales bacterium]|nr:imidazolonepropionase [Bacteroidales bacterium]
MSLLLTNIKALLQVRKTCDTFIAGKQMQKLPKINDAFLLIGDDGKIVDYGEMSQCPQNVEKKIDLTGKFVFPAFNDSHTHLVYAGSREIEYIDKVKGLSYEEIAKRGGGILNSAYKLHNTSESELYEQSLPRIAEVISQGTGAVEIKSGYGLTTKDEIKMLKVIRRIKETMPVEIKSNFLGAHAIPLQYKTNPDKYVDTIVNEMIPEIAKNGLADFIDVFCDRGFFTVEQTERILKAGVEYGLIPKIHANELDFSGGIQVGVKYNALSVDHLEYLGEDELRTLINTRTMPTVLPGASFFLGLPYAPARKMIDYGLPIAIASDFNPGSSPSGNMKLMMSLALINMKLLPEEIFNAVTINTAYAMGIEKEYGSITRGKWANLIVTKEIPTIEYFLYAYGSDLIDMVFLKGKNKI